MESPFTDSPEDREGSSDEPSSPTPLFSQLIVNVELGVQAPVFSQLKWFPSDDRTGHQPHDRPDPPPPPGDTGADSSLG